MNPGSRECIFLRYPIKRIVVAGYLRQIDPFFTAVVYDLTFQYGLHIFLIPAGSSAKTTYTNTYKLA